MTNSTTSTPSRPIDPPVVEYRLLAYKYGPDAEKLDWEVTGFPSIAIEWSDGSIRFWPRPPDGFSVERDEDGFFFKL